MDNEKISIHDSRPNELQRVSSWLTTGGASGSVEIYGLSGFGGIGKSYLLDHAIKQVSPESNGFLKISVNGSDRSIHANLMAIYDKCLRPMSIGGKNNYNYFPRSGKLARRHKELEKRFEVELQKSNSSDRAKTAAQLIFRAGKLLNKCFPKTKEYVDVDVLVENEVDKNIDEAIEVLANLHALDLSKLPDIIKGPLGIGYDDRVKSDLFGLAAEEWIADLSAIFGKSPGKLTQPAIKKYRGLLLVIDDFEILKHTFVDFLLSGLIPILSNTSFPTKIVIVGRDDLFDADVRFSHHHSGQVIDRLRLEKFDPDVTRKMFLNAGYSKNELPKLLEESQGYPFIVSLLCEAKGGTVTFYKQFYERTTRWMSDRQREWVLPLCYLDRIDEQTIECLLGPSESKIVLDWFSNEASLRDPYAKSWVIHPYIRRTLKSYHSTLIDEKKLEEWEQRGQQCIS